ncbi:MAG: hypothetical protein GY749_44000 [Desulfobacteraceae bacterium]|nr:hypothetical protein [Desulfobacteraceae bacterium]
MKIFRILTLTIILIFISCNSIMAAAETSSDLLKSRAKEYWEMKHKKNWAQAYMFFCKKYQEQTTKADFIKSANLPIFAFKIESAETSEDKKSAVITISFDTEMRGFQLKGAKVKEKWIYEGKNWYVCPEKGGFKRMFQK